MRGWISPRASAKDGSYFFPVQNNKCTCKVESARTVPLLLWSKRWKKSERFLDKTGKHKRQSKNLNRPHNNQLEFLLKKKKYNSWMGKERKQCRGLWTSRESPSGFSEILSWEWVLSPCRILHHVYPKRSSTWRSSIFFPAALNWAGRTHTHTHSSPPYDLLNIPSLKTSSRQLHNSSSSSTLASIFSWRMPFICIKCLIHVTDCVFQRWPQHSLHPTCSSYCVTWTLPPRRGGIYVPSSSIWVGLWQWKWRYMTFKARSQKAIQFLPGSLGTLTLGAQPPCCEEAQAMWRGHMEESADIPSWGPRQQLSSFAKCVSEGALRGFQASHQVTSSFYAFPAETLNIKEHIEATHAVVTSDFPIHRIPWA